jgi:superfamily II helicase
MQRRLELEEATRLSDQKAMFELCKKLGHNSRAIERILAANGKPFDSVKEMVDALYAQEEADELLVSTDQDQSVGDSPKNLSSILCPLQEDAQSTVQRGDDQLEPSQLDAEQKQTDRISSCKICALEKANFVDASHVGLPCGHLIYCDSCNTDESRKSLSQQIKCPYPRCEASLSGTIKVYFA